MKRFVLFAGNDYYPQGGWDDMKGDFDTAEEAKQASFPPRDNWHQIVDLDSGKVIATAYSFYSPTLEWKDEKE